MNDDCNIDSFLTNLPSDSKFIILMCIGPSSIITAFILLLLVYTAKKRKLKIIIPETKIKAITKQLSPANSKWKSAEFFTSQQAHMEVQHIKQVNCPSDNMFFFLFIEACLASSISSLVLWWPSMLINLFIEYVGAALLFYLLAIFNKDIHPSKKCNMLVKASTHIYLVSAILLTQVFWCAIQSSLLGVYMHFLYKLHNLLHARYGEELYQTKCTNLTLICSKIDEALFGSSTSMLIFKGMYLFYSKYMFVMAVASNLMKIILITKYEFKKLMEYYQINITS